MPNDDNYVTAHIQLHVFLQHINVLGLQQAHRYELTIFIGF